MKTKEEILKSKEVKLGLTIPYKDLIHEAMEEFASQDKWISVEERLPTVEEHGKKVVILRESNPTQEDVMFFHDTIMVKHCAKGTFWHPMIPLPNATK